MAGYNPAKGEYDPFYHPPQVHRAQVFMSGPGRGTYVVVPEPGPIGKFFRFVFFCLILAFVAMVGLVAVESAGGPTFFEPSLVELLDRASGKSESFLDDRVPDAFEFDIEVDIPADAAEARERFEEEVRRLQASRGEVDVGPPPGFFDGPDASERTPFPTPDPTR